MMPRSTTGPIDELAAILADLRSRTQTLEVIAHRHRFDLDPTPWTAPTLLNSWVNMGGALQVAQYRKVGDMVQIRGAVQNGTIGLVVFTLPVGFRPPANEAFAVVSSGAFGAMTINTAGDVTAAIGSNAAFRLNAAFSVTT